MKKVLIVGSGLSGATCARILADNGFDVEILDKNNHIGGNVYDQMDCGIMVQKYGPHIFHTNKTEVFMFLSKFTNWFPFEHEVLANIKGKMIPVPFNLDSLHILYEKDKALEIENILVNEYGMDNKVPIMELKENPNPDIREFADFVFKTVFEYYTTKQWGRSIDQLDPNIMKRVPVYISRNKKYFLDKFQFQPLNGYTKMVENMLHSPRIKISLGVEARDVLSFVDDDVYYNGEKFEGEVIFTGAIDSLLNNKFDKLPYRSLRFDYETHSGDYQPAAVVNYTVDQDYTRISEFKKFTMVNPPKENTIIIKEYSLEHEDDSQIPYYPIVSEANSKMYSKYVDYVARFKNFHLLGRLGNYKYINMDIAVEDAIKLANQILQK